MKSIEKINARRIETRGMINSTAIRQAEEIIKRATGTPLSTYATRSRKTEYVALRALYTYIAVELGASFLAVGKALGRSHATAIHAYETYSQCSTTWEPLSQLRAKVIALADQQ